MYIISAVIIIGSLSIISFILCRCWYKKSIRMKVPFVGVVYSKKKQKFIRHVRIKWLLNLIWLNNSDAKNLKLDKQSYEDMHIYYIGYVTKKTEYHIDSVNPLYLIIKGFEGYVEKIMTINI